MVRQISDQEYAFLHNKRQVADFVESIWNDPQLNKEAKRLVKKKYPQLQIPDLDIEDKFEQRLQQDRDERQQAENTKREELEHQRWQDERAKTQKQYGFTDEAMTKLEKFMVDKNVGDYSVAASYMAQKEPKPSEAEFTADRWQHEKAPGWADIAKNPEEWGRGEILKAIRADEEKARSQGF